VQSNKWIQRLRRKNKVEEITEPTTPNENQSINEKGPLKDRMESDVAMTESMEMMETKIAAAGDTTETGNMDNQAESEANQVGNVVESESIEIQNQVQIAPLSNVSEANSITPQVEEEVTSMDSVENIVEERKPIRNSFDLDSYSPDPSTKELLKNLVKHVKYEIKLVQLFRDDQVSEDMFMHLFPIMADEITRLSTRREEALNELNGLINEYGFNVMSAQQGIKLLDLRRTLEDINEEEYLVKVKAFNWDINHYGQKILDNRLKIDYIKFLGNLISAEEVEDLKEMATSCMDASSIKNSIDGIKQKIKKAMQEASSILNEISSTQVSV